jgi:viroplasmin and RNaseH domain-containing protein
MAKKGIKFYAVRVGRVPGVYDTWAETEAQVGSSYR